MEKYTIIIAGIEVLLRLVPTKKNLSIIDAIKRLTDVIPNRRKDETR